MKNAQLNPDYIPSSENNNNLLLSNPQNGSERHLLALAKSYISITDRLKREVIIGDKCSLCTFHDRKLSQTRFRRGDSNRPLERRELTKFTHVLMAYDLPAFQNISTLAVKFSDGIGRDSLFAVRRNRNQVYSLSWSSRTPKVFGWFAK